MDSNAIVLNAPARTRFRRFYGCARRYWQDGRHSGVAVTRRRYFQSAAERHGITAEQFDRLYTRCFCERDDPLYALRDRIGCWFDGGDPA